MADEGASNAPKGGNRAVRDGGGPPKGIGAQAGSDRREFRKFRPRPPKKNTVSGEGQGADADGIVAGSNGPDGQQKSSNARRRNNRPPPPRKPAVDGNGVVGDDGSAPAATGEGEAQQQNGTAKKKKPRVRKPPVCRYFNTANGCRLAEECPFRHLVKVTADSGEPASEQPTVSSMLSRSEQPIEGGAPQVVIPPNLRTVVTTPAKKLLKKSDLGSEAHLNTRAEELMYFKRRYRQSTFTKDIDDDIVTFTYDVTDPEWVFDIRSICFSLRLSPDHPLSPPSLLLPVESNIDMPDTLRQHIEKCTNDAIQAKYVQFESRDAYEAIGKLLIRWIDHNILEVFVEGLRRVKLIWDAAAAGISLVVSSATEKKKSDDSEEEVEYGNGEGSSDESFSDEDEEEGEEEEDGSEAVDGLTASAKQMTLTEREGKPPIEVALIWNDVSPTRNIASISPVSLCISTKCGRCTQEHSHDVPTNQRPVAWRCSRCALAQSVLLRASLVHENSPILALLDARGCRPLDCVLLRSSLKFVCFSCNKEDDVQKLNFGQAHKSWCKSCHAACEFLVTAIRFRGDFSGITGEDKDAAKNLPKAKKKVEVRSAITPGFPLPDNGTCKHYKKSYRWFRFPCCGRVYPCDICHAEGGGGTEHETKQANRMICGHCSTEQPYQKNKPCVNCHEAVTRTRTQFWEGGKGCRDQTRMNRNDGKKFSGSRQKTVTKKKVGQLATKNKK